MMPSSDRYKKPGPVLNARWWIYRGMETFTAFMGKRTQRMRDKLMANSQGYKWKGDR